MLNSHEEKNDINKFEIQNTTATKLLEFCDCHFIGTERSQGKPSTLPGSSE